MLMSNGFKSDKKGTDIIPQAATPSDETSEEEEMLEKYDEAYGEMSQRPEGDYACPGEAVLASADPNNFRNFMIHNTVASFASLGVTMLLTSGLPLKNKVIMLILSQNWEGPTLVPTT
ncbi:hypothetical protein K1719_028915 [Acacia pycnantha]|nr:hypothetical protein K1719_028915 [Acacia pycnantha]